MRLLHGALALALAAAGVSAITTANAAGAAPRKIPLVQVVQNGTGGLTLDWRRVRNATKYEVFMADNVNLRGIAKVKATRETRADIGGLRAGSTYCFQVRALNGSTAGKKSPRSCKTTVLARGSDSGAQYRITSYNVCSAKCSGWKSRKAGVVAQIKATTPDVVSLQEAKSDAGIVGGLGSGYALARYKSSKQLIYKTSRFTLKRSGEILLGTAPDGGTHWAVWADLADKAHNGRRVIFADAHTAPGTDTRANDAVRRGNVSRLIKGVQAINTAGSPVVYTGDYNSHKHRTYDSPADLMHGIGYYDAFDLASTLVRPNYNTSHGFDTVPNIGNTWGDHVDHVWVDPYHTRVLEWENASTMDGRRYAGPLPSNHSPLFVKVLVN